MSISDTQASSKSLSTMLQFDLIHRHHWSVRDLKDMLHHELTRRCTSRWAAFCGSFPSASTGAGGSVGESAHDLGRAACG